MRVLMKWLEWESFWIENRLIFILITSSPIQKFASYSLYIGRSHFKQLLQANSVVEGFISHLYLCKVYFVIVMLFGMSICTIFVENKKCNKSIGCWYERKRCVGYISESS